VAARIALCEPETGDELNLLAIEVIVDPRQLLVELGAERPNLAGLRAAPEVIELREHVFVLTSRPSYRC